MRRDSTVEQFQPADEEPATAGRPARDAARTERSIRPPAAGVDPDMPAAPAAFVEADGVQTERRRTLEEGDEQRLTLREERLRIDKEEVEAGTVRVRKVVNEWEETLTVPRRAERLVLEVLPGSGAVTIDGREYGAGDVIEMPLYEEKITVVKETVISEDVTVRKESVEVEERVEETLRREELVVDQDGDLEVTDEEIGAGRRRR